MSPDGPTVPDEKFGQVFAAAWNSVIKDRPAARALRSEELMLYAREQSLRALTARWDDKRGMPTSPEAEFHNGVRTYATLLADEIERSTSGRSTTVGVPFFQIPPRALGICDRFPDLWPFC